MDWDIREIPGLGGLVNRFFPQFEPSQEESEFLGFNDYAYGKQMSIVVKKLKGRILATKELGEKEDFTRRAVGLGLMEYRAPGYILTCRGRRLARYYDGMKFYSLTPFGQEILDELMGRGSSLTRQGDGGQV